MDTHRVDADPDADPDSIYHHDADPDSTFHLDADPDPDPDPDPSFKKKVQTLEIWNSAKIGSYCILYILARHLQIDADPDPGSGSSL